MADRQAGKIKFGTIGLMTKSTKPIGQASRMTSLIVLAALVVVIGLLSFQVLSVFLLPLFLAGMGAVLFQPLHLWLTRRCGNRRRLAAGITTLVILLCVLLPSLGIGLMAASETAQLTQSLDRDALSDKINTLRNRLSVGPPPADVMHALDRLTHTVDELAELPPAERGPAGGPPSDEVKKRIELLKADSRQIETTLGLAPSAPAALPAVGAPPPAATASATAPATTAPAAAPPTAAGTSAPSNASPTPPPAQLVATWSTWKSTLDETPSPADFDIWFAAWDRGRQTLLKFRSELLGGPIAAWFKQNVNIDPDQLQNIVDRIRSSAGPLALGTTQFLATFFVQFSLGLIIMLVSVYYFLVDGREMIASIMRLTPLDRTYLEQLVEEFANLTRAVVLSMLLAAGVQGLLAGIGYYICGLNALFLLTLLTTLFAMLPLVGATAIWGGAALWLYLHDGRPTAAIGLAIYGTVVISLADNLIKPMVLHGRSNLHPLAALLSVIGGVGALGPIGVFIGPMVIALLHTLLVMLRKELTSLERKPAA
jgi:predicted PurR-regulated permease PerM